VRSATFSCSKMPCAHRRICCSGWLSMHTSKAPVSASSKTIHQCRSAWRTTNTTFIPAKVAAPRILALDGLHAWPNVAALVSHQHCEGMHACLCTRVATPEWLAVALACATRHSCRHLAECTSHPNPSARTTKKTTSSSGSQPLPFAAYLNR
jgi:hypothetical protein